MDSNCISSLIIHVTKIESTGLKENTADVEDQLRLHGNSNANSDVRFYRKTPNKVGGSGVFLKD